MPEHFHIDENEFQITIWKLTENLEELCSLLPSLNDTDLLKFKSVKRQREFVGSRVALSSLLKKEVEIRYTSEGKPFLTDDTKISITHSGHWIAIITSKKQDVGIDLEVTNNKVGALFQRFMHPEEQADFNYGEDIRQLQIIWSAKEALYKIIGASAVDFANQLRILPFTAKSNGEITALHLPTGDIYNLIYLFMEDFVLVYCIKTNAK